MHAAETAGQAAHVDPSMRANQYLGNGGGGTAVGIITIEDIMEELIGDDIIDETDRFVDRLKTSLVDRTALSQRLPEGLQPLLPDSDVALPADGTFPGRGPCPELPHGPKSAAHAVPAANPYVTAALSRALLLPRPGEVAQCGEGGVAVQLPEEEQEEEPLLQDGSGTEAFGSAPAKVMLGPFVSSFMSPRWMRVQGSRSPSVSSSVGSMDAAPWKRDGTPTRSDVPSERMMCCT